LIDGLPYDLAVEEALAPVQGQDMSKAITDDGRPLHRPNVRAEWVPDRRRTR
jgi:hypothetical protein